MSALAHVAWRAPAQSRQLAGVLNCALLSDCPGRAVCLERVSQLIERRDAA